ncbi:hypothetical protein ACGFMK_35825 [Amycolatopsis sp. NPDC049252]|uniref:hypothetical protein n=1 Tax=Amycolatopsis sp. NPDC049252 TaxID=3363933 RepID=UPI0037209AAC
MVADTSVDRKHLQHGRFRPGGGEYLTFRRTPTPNAQYVSRLPKYRRNLGKRRKIAVTKRYPDMSQRISRQSITFAREPRVILYRVRIFGFSWVFAERPFPAPVPRVRARAGESFRVG